MSNKKDFDNAIGLAILPLLFVVLWFFSLGGDFDTRWLQLSAYVSSRRDVITWVFSLNAVGLALMIAVVAGLLGMGHFGRKIRQYRKKNASKSKKELLEMFTGGALGSLIAVALERWQRPYDLIFPMPSVIPSYQVELIRVLLQINIVFVGAIFGVCVFKLLTSLKKQLHDGMPPLPRLKNAIVIGTKLVDGAEEWIVLGKNALCAGIMVVASTGWGKSRSCFVPWLRQIMENFTPFPSICIIDPKDTFANIVLELVEKMKLTHLVIHYTLDGKFKTNPIYWPQMLRDSGFLYVAGMLKAATVNFMGKEEGDSKFWGYKGTTLIRNLLVFCAAKYGDYFTLKDFYQEMIEIGDRDFSSELEVAIANPDLHWQERRNMEIARDYFNFEFVNLDQKIRDSISQTASSFLSNLREARLERVFCPPKEEVNFWGFDEIVDEGKIFVFGIDVPGLSGPISVLMKLMYQRSVLSRIKNPKRLESGRLALSIYDEYQSFVSLGGGQLEGDEDYAAKRREALGATIVATQGHSSLLQATGDEVGTDVLIINYRSRIVGNTTDLRTINYYEKIGGEVEEEVESESYTESGQKPSQWPLTKGLRTSDPTVSQSVNRNVQKKPRLSAEILSTLRNFEAVGLIYDGLNTEVVDKICLKPSFLRSLRVSHKKVMEIARRAAVACLALWCVRGYSFPSVCSVVKAPQFESCMEYHRTSCTCPGIPPRPCANHAYYVPSTYIEVTTLPRVSFFKDLPGAAIQLSRVTESPISSGSEEMDSYFFHARVIQVPFLSLAYAGMSCANVSPDRFCFEAMSEDMGIHWKTGLGDSNQPLFKLWSLNVNACYIKGALSAASTGRINKGLPVSSPICSYPIKSEMMFQPVASEICGGWGVLLPRTGFVESNSPISAALLAAQRIRSVGNEVYHSTPIYPDEKWQMTFPQASSCFREGQTLGLVETVHGATERGRVLTPNHNSYLFVIWKKVSCCQDLTSIASVEFSRKAMKAMCQGVE